MNSHINYQKVPDSDASENSEKSQSGLLSLSRKNEKYGAISISRESSGLPAIIPMDTSPVKAPLGVEMIYITAIIADMARGILFPTVITLYMM